VRIILAPLEHIFPRTEFLYLPHFRFPFRG